MQKPRDRWEHDRSPQPSQWAQWARWPQFENRQLEFDGFDHPEFDGGEDRELLRFFVRASSFVGLEI